MKTLLVAAAVAVSLSGAVQTRPATSFDPVGHWTYTSRDDAGAPIAGAMNIAGTPGAYTGTISSGPDRTLQVSDVLTSPTGMIVVANIPDGGVAVIKVWKGADGKLQAGWAPIREVIPATIERGK